MNETSLTRARQRRAKKAAIRCFTKAGASALIVASYVRTSHGAFEYRLNGAASVTYTDNINNAPDEPPEVTGEGPGGASLSREAGLLSTLIPGAMISLLEPRGQLSLAYSRPVTFSTSDVVPSTSSDALVGTGTYELTPLDNVGLSASVTRSSFTALLFNNQAPTAIAGVNNVGTREILRFQFGQSWSRQWTERLSSQQSASFASQLELEDSGFPDTRIATGSAGLSYDHRLGVFGLTLTETATENPLGPTDWMHVVTALASWTRPLDPLTTLLLNIGASKVLGDNPPQLIGGATVTQNREFATWSLGANRTQAADLQTGRVFITDAAVLSVAANPFETTPVSFNTNVIGSRLNSALGQGYTFQASAAISYAHRYFFGNLNYSFLRQIGEDDAPTAIPTLTRNAVMLTLGSMYPPL